MTTTFHLTKRDHQSIIPPYCRIKSRHINEMYERYESGIFDQTTANAVAVALSEKTGQRVSVYQTDGQWFAKIGERAYELPPAAGAWLDRVDRGLTVSPFTLHFGGNPVTLQGRQMVA